MVCKRLGKTLDPEKLADKSELQTDKLLRVYGE